MINLYRCAYTAKPKDDEEKQFSLFFDIDQMVGIIDTVVEQFDHSCTQVLLASGFALTIFMPKEKFVTKLMNELHDAEEKIKEMKAAKEAEEAKSKEAK